MVRSGRYFGCLGFPNLRCSFSLLSLDVLEFQKLEKIRFFLGPSAASIGHEDDVEP